MDGNKSKVEVLKEESRQLRGTIASDLAAEEPSVGGTSRQLLKFHGLYEQDDREHRKHSDKSYSFMIRSKLPGGRLTPAQYLAHDELASRFGNATLRITTRQDLQLHGVLKHDVKPSIAAMNRALVTTFGACGDVVRNVACCPLPATDALRAALMEVAHGITERMMPCTRAYHEIWLDGERQPDGGDTADDEPIYGRTYLPRKFKIARGPTPSTTASTYSTLRTSGSAGHSRGLQDRRLTIVLVGGGHGDDTRQAPTPSRTWPSRSGVRPAGESDRRRSSRGGHQAVQRDHGNRGDRKRARHQVPGPRLGRRLKFRELLVGVHRRRPARSPIDLSRSTFSLRARTLGWHPQGRGRVDSMALSVENGRIKR